MTKKELSSYYYLSMEIKSIKEKILELREENIWSPELTGMPHGSGKSNPVDKTVERIIKLESKLEVKKQESLSKLLEVETFIESIDDPVARVIFRKRYIEFETWVKISMDMYMCERNVFRIHKKTLEKYKCLKN